jgi:hypothetical protein
VATKQPKEVPVTGNDRERAVKYYNEFKSFRDDLKPYWTQMEKNEEMYQFYKREYKDSDSEISLNTPFSIVESQIAKENKTTIQVTVKAKGENGMEEFEKWIASTLKGAIEDPDIAALHGTFRKIKETFSRQLKVVGNSVAEINFCYRTEIINGEKKVIADNPYTKVRHWKSVVFNPTRQFNNSDVYYIEDWVKMSDLKSKEYTEGKDGKGKGMYKNLAELQKSLDGTEKVSDDPEGISFIAGSRKVARKNEPIHVITRWEGTKRTIIANGKVIIGEHVDPFKIGRHNLLLACRYLVVDRPYAYGEIDAIYKPVRAQDTIMSQSIDMVNKYLRGSYVNGPGIGVDEFMQVLEFGGVMQGDPTQIGLVPTNVPPAQAFQTIDVMQQAIERAARYSPYASGSTGQSSDKTQGTASGIASLQAAAEPNSQIQTDDMEEMFMQPLARLYLMMIANFMTEDDVRYALLEGQNKSWVKATKNILRGKATLQDMLASGMVSQQEIQELTMMEQPVLDPMGQPVIDPQTGQPAVQMVPIPGADKALVFDVDWLVDVKLDSQTAAGKEMETQKQMALIQFGQQMGVQFKPKDTVSYLGARQDFEHIDDLMLSDEEVQAQQQQQIQAQQMQQAQQQQSEMQKMDMQHQQQLALEQAKQMGNQPLPVLSV